MTTPATPAPRYRNYGELINPATNTCKFWLVEERQGRSGCGTDASPRPWAAPRRSAVAP